jgi:haloalkane dehalogenase
MSQKNSVVTLEDWKLVDSPVRAECLPDDSGVPVKQTESGVKFVRTPEERFKELPDFDFEPHYTLVDGLRMHYVDEGPRNGEIILLLHGEPTWSYLYRKMIPPLRSAGFRVIAADHIGMGRSDKPVELGAHTFEQHVRRLKQLIAALGLHDVTLFGQDWGGIMGLRVVGDMPDIFCRVIAANTTLILNLRGANPLKLPAKPVEIDCKLSEPRTLPQIQSPEEYAIKFQEWINYALTTPNFTPSQVVGALTLKKLDQEVARAYDAPYPSFIYKAAVRALPSMAARITDESAPAWETLGRFNKPFLFLAGQRDPGQGSVLNQVRLTNHIPGASGQKHERFDAGHFIQEDIGKVLAEHVVQFIGDNPRT